MDPERHIELTQFFDKVRIFDQELEMGDYVVWERYCPNGNLIWEDIETFSGLRMKRYYDARSSIN